MEYLDHRKTATRLLLLYMKVSTGLLFNNVYASLVAATIEKYGYAEYTYRTTLVEINY